MKTWIGTTSATAAQTSATVWKRKDPAPIAARISASTWPPRSRCRLASCQLTKAATRKLAFESAFNGSDQKLASVRSQ